ncbi:hypothetical protein ScPMuIL_010882 [Solemya velum]
MYRCDSCIVAGAWPAAQSVDCDSRWIFNKKKDETGKFEMSDGITLLDTGLSPPCHRVRIVLAEKGIPYKKVPINIVSGEQFSEEFRKFNPNMKVPVLVVKGVKSKTTDNEADLDGPPKSERPRVPSEKITSPFS